ncbi:MAG: hypothetical protein MUE73_08380 [Planctomycetes bacterium]|nr:hypothetical protein [Planctomycetota bacterium]
MVIPCPECGAPLLEVSDTTSCSACSRSFTAGDLVREAAGLVDSAGGLSVRKEAESHARAMKLCDRAIAILTPLRESGRDGLTGLLAAAHMNRGTALRWDADPRALGDYDRALELLDRPENAGHHRSLRAVLRIHRALALEGMGERARAVEDELDEAWAEDLPPLLEAGAPGAVPIALECLELLLAGYTALDRDACGLEVAEEAIDRLPGEPGVYDQVSEWLMRLSWSERTSENRRERTRALFGRMVRSHRLFFGDNARGASLEARFALALDRAGEAVGLLRAYRARCPLDPAGAAGLAEVLALLGEAGDAREVLGAVPDLLLAGAAGATAAEREDLAPYASWLRGELLELGLGLCLGGLRTELDPWCLGENRRAREAALAWIGRIERAAGDRSTARGGGARGPGGGRHRGRRRPPARGGGPSGRCAALAAAGPFRRREPRPPGGGQPGNSRR